MANSVSWQSHVSLVLLLSAPANRLDCCSLVEEERGGIATATATATGTGTGAGTACLSIVLCVQCTICNTVYIPIKYSLITNLVAEEIVTARPPVARTSHARGSCTITTTTPTTTITITITITTKQSYPSRTYMLYTSTLILCKS